MRGIRSAAALGLVLATGLAGALLPVTAGAVGDAATTERVSVADSGVGGDARSTWSVASADGRLVAFSSRAANLVPGDEEGTWDVFLRDLGTGTTRRISAPGPDRPGGGINPSISADGRFVAYQTWPPSQQPSRVLVHDTRTGRDDVASVSRSGVPGTGGAPSISADGRFVAFSSGERLVPRDTNRQYDVYVRDRERGITRRVSVSDTERQANGLSEDPVISADGRFVAFSSYASNLVRRDTGSWDVFVRDRARGTTEKVSVDVNGRRASSGSRWPSMSASGRFIAFSSYASDLVRGDTNGTWDVFVRDLRRGTTSRVSVSTRGRQGDGASDGGILSLGGRYVTFTSRATNLVRRDTNGVRDAFVHDRRTGTTRRVSLSDRGTQGHRDSYAEWVSRNGVVAGFSTAARMVPDDVNGVEDVFVRR